MAFKYVFVLSLLIAVTGTFAADNAAGVASTASPHPYAVSIQGSDGTHICGGALISANIVATTAQCLANYDVPSLVVRLSDGKIIKIAGYTFDGAYDFVTNENDVGLLKLAQYASVKQIAPASSQHKTGTSATVVGFDSKNALVQGPVSLITYTDCSSKKYNYYEKGDLFGTQLCGLSGNPCFGESGNPLVANNKLVGLTSWAYACSNKSPAVYTNIAALNSWIANTSKNL